MINYNVAVLIALFGKRNDLTRKVEKGLINPNKCR